MYHKLLTHKCSSALILPGFSSPHLKRRQQRQLQSIIMQMAYQNTSRDWARWALRKPSAFPALPYWFIGRNLKKLISLLNYSTLCTFNAETRSCGKASHTTRTSYKVTPPTIPFLRILCHGNIFKAVAKQWYGYTHRDMNWWQGFVKHTIEMGSVVMLYVPRFIKIGILRHTGSMVMA